VGELGSILVLALLAMFNPTLLAAVTVMMLLPNTKKLMLGYLFGAYLTSISLGLLIVFSLHGSDSVETSKQTLSPIEDVVIGLVLLLVAYVLGGGRTESLRERRRQRKEAKEKEKEPKKSLPEKMLGSGSARITFAAGVLLTLPGVSYLAALDRMAKMDLDPALTALLVIAFCLVQQLLLEIPLLGYAFAPERTQEAVTDFRDWLGRSGRRVATIGLAVIGALLVIRGIVELAF
jgi:Ca2+/Na+ antiporter